MRFELRLVLMALAVIILLPWILPSGLWDDDYQKGLDAYDAGNYATALAKLTPLAEEGRVKPQFYLGVMYDDGKGVSQDYVEAAKWYRLAAEADDAKAQNNLGEMYAEGKGVSQDYAEAEKWFRLAAEAKYVEAQNNLGLMYAEGKGIPQDYILAYAWYSRAIAKGNDEALKNRNIVASRMSSTQIAEAQFALGNMYAQDATKNKYFFNDSYNIEAAKWYRLAAEAGVADADSQFFLGLRYADGKGVPKNYAESIKWIRLAAEAGHTDAQLNLGLKYANGRGVPQDDAEAVKWFRLAAENDGNAHFNLRWMYANGRGVVPPEDAEAMKWTPRAAESGHLALMYNSAVEDLDGEGNLQNNRGTNVLTVFGASYLGLNYATGNGVPQDYAEALKWFRLADEAGDTEAPCRLKAMYVEYEGSTQNCEEIKKWTRLAAEAGIVEAQNDLGAMYASGRDITQDNSRADTLLEWAFGNSKDTPNDVPEHIPEHIPQDNRLAYMWYNLAAAQGDKKATESRDEIARIMTPEQITEAQEMSLRCLAREYKGC